MPSYERKYREKKRAEQQEKRNREQHSEEDNGPMEVDNEGIYFLNMFSYSNLRISCLKISNLKTIISNLKITSLRISFLKTQI